MGRMSVRSRDAVPKTMISDSLAGEPVNRRWTEERRKLFHSSRIGVTERIAAARAQAVLLKPVALDDLRKAVDDALATVRS